MFFSTFLILYILINAYIYFRGFAALEREGRWVIWLKLLFGGLVVAYPVMHSLEDGRYGPVWDIASVIGSLWVVAMVYFFLIVLISDIVRVVDRFVSVIPARLKKNRTLSGRIFFFGSVAIVFLIIFFGWLNTQFIRVENLDLYLAKLPKANNPTTVVFASDFHIGPTVHERRVRAFVDEINAQKPDIILLGGDLVEGSVEGLGRTSQILARLKAPRGVYAVLGNHEYHGGAEKTEAFIKSAGITVLRNEVVTLPGVVNIVGLDDPRSGGREASVADLVKRGDRSLPTILLSHRPTHMEEYAKDGIDLMLAGHSHHGQFFPLTLVTDYVYTVSYGYERIGPMNVYVTSGLGTWGPPVRVLTSPEIVRITLKALH